LWLGLLLLAVVIVWLVPTARRLGFAQALLSFHIVLMLALAIGSEVAVPLSKRLRWAKRLRLRYQLVQPAFALLILLELVVIVTFFG
jgi:NhaP-type Na+/H+ or K+/H+ antiporter